MSLKQSPACVLVDGKRVKVVEIADALLKSWMLQALVDGVGEQLNVGVERELVHGIDTSHVVHDKEENRCPLSTRPVALQVRHNIIYSTK